MVLKISAYRHIGQHMTDRGSVNIKMGGGGIDDGIGMLVIAKVTATWWRFLK